MRLTLENADYEKTLFSKGKTRSHLKWEFLVGLDSTVEHLFIDLTKK